MAQGPYMLSGGSCPSTTSGTVILLTIWSWDPFARGIQFKEIGELKETSWIQAHYQPVKQPVIRLKTHNNSKD